MNASPTCVVCAASAFRELYPAMAEGFSVAECSSCGARRTMPDVLDEEIGRYYPQEYYGRDNKRFNVVMEYVTRAIRKRRAREVAARIGTVGKVMDVGCGRGIILSELQKLGYEPFGIELSDGAAAHARSLGVDVGTDLFDSRYSSGDFAAVTFWHSLEHIRRADLALQRATELLAPGGVLGIAVPNSASLQAALFKQYWFHLDVPRHYHHFRAENVEQMMRRVGLEPFERSTLSIEQNPYGYVQSGLNAAGAPENLLYSLLKDPSARTHAVGQHPVAALLSAAAATPLAVAGMWASAAEAAMGRGGTIEIWARKR